jgi:hypothetical protein
MNPSIKRRQSLLINWLSNKVNCKVSTAITGTKYVELNTMYTGSVSVRISDHLSNERTYIHVILSSLNTSVIINYKNFIWSGSFNESKMVIYSLIMCKNMFNVETPASTVKISPALDKNLKAQQEILFTNYVNTWKKDIKSQIIGRIKTHPEELTAVISFMVDNSRNSSDKRRSNFLKFKQKMKWA